MLAKRLIAAEEDDWSHYTCGELQKKKKKKKKKVNCRRSTTMDSIIQMNRMRNPLIQAAENSIEELAEEILEICPDAAYTVDRNGRNILHIAVEKKDRGLYRKLKAKVRKDVMLTAIDNEGNTILHLAAKRAEDNPKIFLGHLNQMAWDVCWFKWIRYDSPPYFQDHLNFAGKKPHELFRENHVTLREKAEKTVKDMNTGLMLVATLISTVNYGTLFSIPGGYNEDTSSKNFGFLKALSTERGHTFIKFLGFTGAAVFFSIFALAIMLMNQLSRFSYDDFFRTLPVRHVAALIALAISAFCSFEACADIYYIIGIGSDPLWFMMCSIVIFLILWGIDTAYPTFEYIYLAFCRPFFFMNQEM